MAGIQPLQIDAQSEKNLSSDFARLRQHSIELLQDLTGATWTDYNLHDPGVTILELLCFAITDLSYRTGFPLPDILSLREGKHREWENAFFSARQILPTSAITVNDLRKVILDEVEEVSNVWIVPVVSAYSSNHVKGLYNIYVQMGEEMATGLLKGPAEEDATGGIKATLREKIKKAYVSRRNVGEDCVREVVLMQPVKVQVLAEVEVHERWTPEQVLADIYDKVSAYFNAPVRMRSEEELLQQGWTTERLYTGPLLKRGFIRDEELMAPLRQIDPADLVDLITRVKGVLLVKNLSISMEGRSTDKAPLLLGPLQFPLLDKDPEGSHIQLYKNRYELQVRDPVLQDLLPAIRQKRASRQRMVLAGSEPVSVPLQEEQPPGNVKLSLSREAIEKYYSIQDHFPLIYGIGSYGLPYNDPSRRAKARQLKGYLLLFEQVMANYLSQLAHLSDFFSIGEQGVNPRSYYSQPLYDVPGAAELLKDGYERVLREAIEPETVYQRRKNAVYDHLLARHNEALDEYPVTLYDHHYGKAGDVQKFDTLLKWKAAILFNMPELSHDRARAFDYMTTADPTRTVVGLEKRMSLLLHIPLGENRALTSVFHQQNISLSEPGKPRATAESFRPDAEGLRPDAEGFRRDARRPTENEGSQDSGPGTNADAAGSRASSRGRGSEGAGAGGTGTGSVILENQTISLFRYGIDPANYKIVPQEQDEGMMQVLYTEPEKQEKVIARGRSRDEAVKLIDTMIDSLKRISLESEGFHLVEHVLLRPTLTGASFGWGLYAREKERVAKHKSWMSFEEREESIREILEAAGSGMQRGKSGGESIRTVQDRLAALCDCEQDPRIVRDALRLYQPGGKCFFPRWEFYTRRWGHSMLVEDFFNFRMTVVLPAWPARFQRKNFRMFTEDLFQRHGPAHLRLHFLWLGISDMQKFEQVYFDWRNLFSNREGNLDSCEETEKLIDLIHSHPFRVV